MNMIFITNFDRRNFQKAYKKNKYVYYFMKMIFITNFDRRNFKKKRFFILNFQKAYKKNKICLLFYEDDIQNKFCPDKF